LTHDLAQTTWNRVPATEVTTQAEIQRHKQRNTPATKACDDAAMTETTNNILICSECAREWADSDEHWLAFLDVDDEVALFCPACVAREFDSA
jgi:hypothetical protein